MINPDDIKPGMVLGEADAKILRDAINRLNQMELKNLSAPAAVPVDVVPGSIEPEDVSDILDPTANPDEYACCVGRDMWEACRAAILRRIEGLK